ncbi:MAG: hypothetical protein GY810_06620 [Aureispira sp.]|nr:hypothetical protein [Aureispira sp.]
MNKVIEEFLGATDKVLNSQSFFLVFDNIIKYKGETDQETIQNIIFSKEFDEKWEQQDQKRGWELFLEWKEDNNSKSIKKKVKLELDKIESINQYLVNMLIANAEVGFSSPYQTALSIREAESIVFKILAYLDVDENSNSYKIKPNFLYEVGAGVGLEYLWSCGLDRVTAIITASKIAILMTNGSS